MASLRPSAVLSGTSPALPPKRSPPRTPAAGAMSWVGGDRFVTEVLGVDGLCAEEFGGGLSQPARDAAIRIARTTVHRRTLLARCARGGLSTWGCGIGDCSLADGPCGSGGGGATTPFCTAVLDRRTPAKHLSPPEVYPRPSCLRGTNCGFDAAHRVSPT